MRVLLVSPNRERVPDPVFPLGLAYVASALLANGHEVKAVDLCFSEGGDASISSAISEAIRDFRPEAVGLSLRNIDDVAYPKKHSYLDEYRAVVREIRAATDAPLVLGGSGFTIMPSEFMAALGADYGIAGEGEAAFPKLIERLGGKRTGNRIKRAPRVSALDSLLPERGIFDVDGYYKYGGMLNIQTKRGCPYKCVYCTYPKVEGKRSRLRSPASVADEIERTKDKTGVRHYFMVDSVFNSPAKHAKDICREIINRKLDVNWSCYCNVGSVTPELVDLMQKAGCTSVEFGTDSLMDKTLRMLGKSFRHKDITSASRACREAGMKFCHFVFVGAPGDTKEGALENLNRLDALEPDAAVIMAGIRVFPGTVLADRAAREFGAREIGLDPVFYISPEVAKNIDIFIEAVRRRRRWAAPGFEINMYERLQRKLRESGIKGSLWEGIAKKYG